MDGAPRLDFDGLARAALSQAHDLLPRWFPAGKFLGREFVVGDLSGTPGESLSINTQTGRWSDFATDDRGGDLISLFAAMHRIGQGDAAKQLAGVLGRGLPPIRVTPLPTPESAEWSGIFPIPVDAPPPPGHHPRFGAPKHIARYRDPKGQLLALVYRCEPPTERKQVVPLTFCQRRDGRQEWRWQSLPKPRSLYGLELLVARPNDPVLVVEGEPKCDAARALIGTDTVVVSWCAGAKAWKHVDWLLLARRTVIIWPDADEPGWDAARHIAEQLAYLGAKVRIVAPPAGVEDGWDIGDAIREGWTAERIASHLAPLEETEPPPPEDDPEPSLPVVYFNAIQPKIDAADFVEGILIDASMSVVYGQSNSGKTFWTADLGLHVASGRTWYGRATEQRGVLWLAMEGSYGIFNRVAAWRRHHGITDLPFVVIPVALNLLHPDADTGRLIQTIRAIKSRLSCPIGWTIADTLSRAMAGGNENAPDDMGALVSNGTRIQQETQSALTWIHHSGKDDARGARGHSLLRAATDTEIEIVADGPQRMATVTKQREMECHGEFSFTLKVIELGVSKRGKPITSCIVDHGDAASAPAKPRLRLKGHVRRAHGVLHDLLAEKGAEGFPGVPPGFASIPEAWWRQRFYERTASDGKDDLAQNSKRMAFNRAVSELIDDHLAAVNKGRVWAVRPAHDPHKTPAQNDE